MPHQSLQQQNTNVDYLDLNVPVDENVFYSSNGEQSITASTSHYLEVRGEQNISNIGTQIIQSTNSSVIYNETNGNSIGFQTNQQPLPLLTNFARDYGTARAQASVMTVPQVFSFIIFYLLLVPKYFLNFSLIFHRYVNNLMMESLLILTACLALHLPH